MLLRSELRDRLAGNLDNGRVEIHTNAVKRSSTEKCAPFFGGDESCTDAAAPLIETAKPNQALQNCEGAFS